MVALQIRNVPDDVRDALAERARSRGESLQAYLLEMVTREAGWNRNVEILERISRRLTDSQQPSPSTEDILESIDLARQERDARLLQQSGEQA
ncbi:FitA-like ribbon-helix-helix domain-containing protein [Actinomyces timonensis]|jgi:hypothetical protein|uniref:FitA-like ribbon-helix-helix domain-containing protein n=1 Tax=Actinomyces timonensis TaxID=1288391 RepID=UPI0002D63B01|nr:hypothetical protein [Actinomyces timonensis]